MKIGKHRDPEVSVVGLANPALSVGFNGKKIDIIVVFTLFDRAGLSPALDTVE